MKFIYARLIVKKLKRIEEVPDAIRPDVEKVLQEWGYDLDGTQLPV